MPQLPLILLPDLLPVTPLAKSHWGWKTRQLGAHADSLLGHRECSKEKSETPYPEDLLCPEVQHNKRLQ